MLELSNEERAIMQIAYDNAENSTPALYAGIFFFIAWGAIFFITGRFLYSEWNIRKAHKNGVA